MQINKKQLPQEKYGNRMWTVDFRRGSLKSSETDKKKKKSVQSHQQCKKHKWHLAPKKNDTHFTLGTTIKLCFINVAGKRGGEIGILYTVGGTTRQCSCYGKQYTSSSKHWKQNDGLIQQFHFWAYIRKNWNQDFKAISALLCSQLQYSQ